MTESISSEDPHLNTIALLQRIIEQLHVDRLIYEAPTALFGWLNVVSRIENDILTLEASG